MTAHVTVAGQDQGTTHNVSCTQVGWSHTFDIGDKASGTTVVVDTGNQVTPRSVEIRNIAGFSGSYSAGTFGNAQAAVTGHTFIVTGTALGFMADQPRNRVPQQFTIKVNC